MYLTFGRWVARLVPLWLDTIVCFNTNGVLSHTKPSSWIGVEIGHFYLKKEGPMLKPSSSRWGKCQGWKSCTLACQTPFQKRHPWTFLRRYLDSPIDLEIVDVVFASTGLHRGFRKHAGCWHGFQQGHWSLWSRRFVKLDGINNTSCTQRHACPHAL